ncbi:MAG TPA: hypothetical protein VI338_05545 [Nitrososphaera sp.]|nr:hypothetical protein [Nitrososphaera sp.]
MDQTTMQDSTVTIRQRDSMQQERIAGPSLKEYFNKVLSNR